MDIKVLILCADIPTVRRGTYEISHKLFGYNNNYEYYFTGLSLDEKYQENDPYHYCTADLRTELDGCQFPENSFDLVISEGCLIGTELNPPFLSYNLIHTITKLLRVGGYFIFNHNPEIRIGSREDYITFFLIGFYDFYNFHISPEKLENLRLMYLSRGYKEEDDLYEMMWNYFGLRGERYYHMFLFEKM